MHSSRNSLNQLTLLHDNKHHLFLFLRLAAVPNLRRSVRMAKPMSESEAENENEIDVSGQFMWDKVTHNFLTSSLKDSVTHLNLASNHVSFESAQVLSRFLQSPDSQLECLSLTNCRLISKSATVIFAALGNSKLIEFYADDNTFNEENCKVLAASLAKNPPLEVLSLVGCDIPAEGVVPIAIALKSNKNLKVLRLECNSMFEIGARALGQVLPLSGVEELSVADNEIWKDGMSALVEGCIQTKTLKAVDFAYNIMDLVSLGRYVVLEQLEALCVSGCKVTEMEVGGFIDAIGRSHLKRLIIDGFNYNTLPVSWPKVRDEIWQNETFFQHFLKSVENCRSLVDLRLGYMELEQVEALMKMLEQQEGREISVSFHDFGRTWNCWVLEMPRGVFHAPTEKFEWKGGLNEENCGFIGTIVKNTVVGEDDVVTEVNMNSCAMPDPLVKRMLATLEEHPLVKLDLTNNELTDESVQPLLDYFAKTKVGEFIVDENKLSDEGCGVLVEGLVGLPKTLAPKILRLTFNSDNMDELGEHETPTKVAEMFKKNYNVTTLALTGPISGNDAVKMIAEMASNSHIRHLEFDSDFVHNYASPAPNISDEVQTTFTQLTDTLWHTLRDKKSQCKLQSFKFPLLTEIFLYQDDILAQWPECEAKMEQNKTTKSGRRK